MQNQSDPEEDMAIAMTPIWRSKYPTEAWMEAHAESARPQDLVLAKLLEIERVNTQRQQELTNNFYTFEARTLTIKESLKSVTAKV